MSDTPEVYTFSNNARSKRTNLLNLTCLATGFYPKGIHIGIWMNDWLEKEGYPDHVLPNGDGTYQIRVNIEADMAMQQVCCCKVDHRVLDKHVCKWETGEMILFVWGF